MKVFMWIAVGIAVLFAAFLLCKKGYIKSVLAGVILLIIAFLSLAVVGTAGFLYGIYYAIRHKGLYDYFFRIAVSLDQMGNVLCAHFFNGTMIKSGGTADRFGNPDETISSVFGKNKLSARLNGFGRFWAGLLNAIQENHVENSIEQII